MALRLRELRRARGWSQCKLAKKSDTARSYISELESGRYDPTKTICKLCRALGCTPNDLIDCEEDGQDGSKTHDDIHRP